ncbi:MAG: hypothetical protein COB94_007785 [Gammaproteobacteria bacterium]|nr:hypothetical protein [Gammaproteobacteria bacterium]
MRRIKSNFKNKSLGMVTVEYLVVALALLATWGIMEFVMDRMAEHQFEYTQSIAQPF